MTVYYQMTELTDVDTSVNLSHSTDGNYYNGGNVRMGFNVGGGGTYGNDGAGSPDTYSYFKGPSFSATTLWLHVRMRCYGAVWWANINSLPTNLASQSMIKIMAGGTKRFRVIITGNYTIQLDRWNGSSWVTLSSYNTIYGYVGFYDSVHTFDIRMTIGVSTDMQVYLDNNVILAASGVDTTFGGTVTAFDDIYFSQPSGNAVAATYSEIICADWNTVGSKVVVRVPDANGANAEWYNGAYTVVDEMLGGTDYATSATANQRVDWSLGTFPTAGANEIIPYAKLTAIVNRDLTGPQNMNFYVNRGSINYDAGDQTLPLIQSARSQLYLTDPATGDVWTTANLNASTFGIRSRT